MQYINNYTMPVTCIKSKEQLYNILDDTTAKEKYVLLDIFANWCMPCMQFAPKLEELSDVYGDDIKFIKLDVDELPFAMEEYTIIKLPTFLIFNRGERISKYEPIYGTKKHVIEERLSRLDNIAKIDDDF